MASKELKRKVAEDEIYNSNYDWRYFPKWCPEYEKGVDEFLDKAFFTQAVGDQIACPCKECTCRYWLQRSVIRDHLICNKFCERVENYYGEHLDSVMCKNFETEEAISDHGEGLESQENIDGLLNVLREGPNEEAKKFLDLVEDGQQELYPGCNTFSKLSFTIRLCLYKTDHKISNAAFGYLLVLLKDLLPDAKLPSSFNDAKNVIKVLGLDYVKIDACPKDCMLYWEEHEEYTSCHVCKTSRWTSTGEDEAASKAYKIPAKILRYFPIKNRLQRLFMCLETVSYMLWHAKGRQKHGMLRHPANGEAWKEFDLLYPSFASDFPNVKLGLATDGFSPFNMGIVHSTWPVIHAALWEVGLETYDALNDVRFNMHAALVSNVSDLPAMSMMYGWTTKRKKAYPCCHYDNCSIRLKHSGKECYKDHRRWLRMDHHWRRSKKFNGEVEVRSKPERSLGTEVVRSLMVIRDHLISYLITISRQKWLWKIA